MKNYGPDIRWGLHTVRVSFRRWDYKGYVTFVKGGNYEGSDILELEANDSCDKKFKESPINFRLFGAGDDGGGWFAVTSKNNKDELFTEDKWKCLKDYILGVETIDFRQEK